MNRLLTSLIFSLVASAAIGADQSRPKLVVGIMVDQLRSDYIEFLQTRLGEKGFKRLLNNGVYLRDVDFGLTSPDKVSATALLFTGAYPQSSGVPSAEVYDASAAKYRRILDDGNTMGNYTSETYSPAGLLLSTVSDEIMIDGAGLGAVYSLAVDPQQAIIMAGHAGNSAAWINDNTGRWATTTYYKDVPASLNRFNQSAQLSSRLDTMQWRPSIPLERYQGVPAQKRYYPFRYTFPRSDRNVYRMFLDSPLANREITDMAIDYLQSLQLGKRGDAIDMLNLGYTAAPYKYVKDGDYRLELQDTYLRLDAQLARLFDAIDKSVGLANTLIFLSSTGYYDDAIADDAKYRIPTGDFSAKRAVSLINAYLSAKYGMGDYIDTFAGHSLYLDHKALEAKKLEAAAIADDVRDFLCRMSGVTDAYTIRDILGQDTPGLQKLRRSINPKTAGDIYVEFQPGWNLVEDLTYPVKKLPVRSTVATTPVLIMGPGLAPATITAPVDATAIAPALCGAMHIRSPNGATRRAVALQ